MKPYDPRDFHRLPKPAKPPAVRLTNLDSTGLKIIGKGQEVYWGCDPTVYHVARVRMGYAYLRNSSVPFVRCNLLRVIK